MDSFLKDIIAGEFGIALTKATLHRGDGQEHSGSGHFAWTPNGCEMNAVTNGGAIVQQEFGTFPGKPGEIIPDEHYLALTGTTQDGWGIKCERLDNGGYHLHFGSETLTWRFDAKSFRAHVVLEREHSSDALAGHGFDAIGSGIEIGTWPRTTSTTSDNPVFGGDSFKRDWLQYKTIFGEVSVRQLDSDFIWIRVRNLVGVSVKDALAAVTAAISYVDGRSNRILATRELEQQIERRWLMAHSGPSRNGRSWGPFNNASLMTDSLEPLLACLTNYFMTEQGIDVAELMYACIDSTDNRFTTRVMVQCATAESLANIFSDAIEDKGTTNTTELSDAVEVMKTALRESTPAQRIVDRFDGLFGSLNRPSAKDRFYQLLESGWGGITADEIAAWGRLRNKVMHGSSVVGDASVPKFQKAVNEQGVVANLINKMVLQAASYSGAFFDYSRWGAAPFAAKQFDTPS